MTTVETNYDTFTFVKYDTMLSTESEMYFAQDKDPKTKAKRYFNTNINEVLPYLEVDNNLYELMLKDKPRKMYIDFDCKYNSIRDFCEGKNEDYIIKELTSIVDGWIEDFQEEYFSNYDPWIVHITNASNKIKYSFHFVVDVKIANADESKYFHDKFKSYIDERYGDDPEYHGFNKYIDTNVYSKNQPMRCINQSKMGEDRPLQIYRGSKYLKDHLITFFNTNVPEIILPPLWIKNMKLKNQKREILLKQLPEEKNYNEDEELQWLVEHTQHKTENYNDWIQWIWACLGAGISPEIIHQFSFEGCPEKYDANRTDDIIRQYVSEKSTLGFNTLKHWAREAGHELSREIEKKQKPLSVKKEDHLTWIDLVKKYSNKQFETYSCEGLISIIRDDVAQVVSMIQGSTTLFTVYANDDEPYALTKRLCKLDMLYKKGDDFAVASLQKLMEKYPLEFPLYNKLVFKPNDYGLKRNERNTFTGFQAQKQELVDHKAIEPILFHIKEVLANGDEQIYKYILSWFAQIIKTPYKPTDVFMLFQGAQGSGKTIIAEFFVKYVFGKNLSLSTSGINSLVSRFNGAVKSKLFVTCNELTNIDTTKGAFNSAFDRMKNLITDRLVQIELKGLEHIQIENYCNFMGTTNHEFTAKLEQSDRRYACFSVSDKYVGDYDYFDKLGNCMNQENADMLYTYFLNYPSEEMVDLRRIPMTELRKAMMDSSRNSVEMFIEELLNEEVDCVNWINEDEKKIASSDLFTAFVNWCTRNGEKSYPHKVMARMIPKKLIEDVGNTRIEGKRTRWIQFN